MRPTWPPRSKRSRVAFVATALLATLAACTRGDNVPLASVSSASSDVSAAQHESEQAYTTAANAEANARAKAEAADRAEYRAIRKRQDAQQAEEQAIQARQAAEEAQQQAIIAGRDAARRAEAAQQRALREQPNAQAESQQSGAIATTRGTIDRTANGELIITRNNAPELRLKIDPRQTSVLQNGQTVELGDLPHGTPVTVSYRLERDQPIAQMIEAGDSPPLQTGQH